MWPFSNSLKYNTEVIEFCRQWEKSLKGVPGGKLRDKIDVVLKDDSKLKKRAHWLITIRNKCAHDADYYVSAEDGLIEKLRIVDRDVVAAFPKERQGCLLFFWR